MTLDPFFHGCNVFLCVFEIFTYFIDLAARYHAVLWRLARLGLDRPTAVLNASREMVGTTVGFSVLKVQVLGSCGGVEGEISMRTLVRTTFYVVE